MCCRRVGRCGADRRSSGRAGAEAEAATEARWSALAARVLLRMLRMDSRRTPVSAGVLSAADPRARFLRSSVAAAGTA